MSDNPIQLPNCNFYQEEPPDRYTGEEDMIVTLIKEGEDMNFEVKIEDAIRTAREALTKAENLKDKFNCAKDFTDKLLMKCQENGITKISIGTKTEKVPATMGWPFGHGHSIFQYVPKRIMEKHDWPAIWGISKEMGIYNGCGNGDQAQVDTSNLVDGVYEFRRNKWLKVDP